MQRTHEPPTQASWPDPHNVIGVCAYCNTANVARVLVTDEDGSSNPRLVCADPAFCAGAQPVTTGTDDGYTVTASGLQALDEAVPGEAPGTAAQVLRSAALYLERHGWITGAYYDATAGTFTPPACMVGAIGMACYGGPVDAPAQHFDDPGFLDFEEAVLHLDRYLLAEDGTEAYEFNDARGRTVDQVTDVLRKAAARPAEELIDALKVVDARNADVAAIAELLKPSGIWGDPDADDEQPPQRHIQRPHLPGNLFDCPTCEQRCFCGDLPWRCVHCALQDQRNREAAAQDGDVR
jgi:hypothetical protein